MKANNGSGNTIERRGDIRDFCSLKCLLKYYQLHSKQISSPSLINQNHNSQKKLGQRASQTNCFPVKSVSPSVNTSAFTSN